MGLAAAIALVLALAPIVAPVGQAPPPLVLKAATPVPLTVSSDVNSKTHGQGDRFELTVSEDVMVAGQVAIPRGAAAVGEVARHVAKGAFGKAGKLEIRLLHVIVDGRRVRLDGEFDRRGRSADVPAAAVGTAVAGVLGAAILGKDASIPAGTQITGYIHRDILLTQPKD